MTLKKLLEYVFEVAKGHTEKTFDREEIGRWLTNEFSLDPEVSELLKDMVEIRVLRVPSGSRYYKSEDAINPMANEGNVVNYRVYLLSKFPKLVDIKDYLDLEIVFKKTKGVWRYYHVFPHCLASSELDEIDLERPLIDFVNKAITYKSDLDRATRIAEDYKSFLDKLSIEDIHELEHLVYSTSADAAKLHLFEREAEKAEDRKYYEHLDEMAKKVQAEEKQTNESKTI
jgi:hypothetical protein